MSLNKGFTLIELMVVISVIGILSTIALFGIGKTQASARDTKRQQIMNGIRTALERYYGDSQGYPNTAVFCTMMTTLTSGTYLTAPTDPCSGSPAICGTGTVSCGGVNVIYAYTSTGATYTLTLTKESGGINTFSSPQ